MSIRDITKELDIGMTNFDHTIDDGLDVALREKPGEVHCHYAGWNFSARVWFADGQFHAEVWVSGSINEVISEDSLEEIMSSVCDKYGSD